MPKVNVDLMKYYIQTLVAVGFNQKQAQAMTNNQREMLEQVFTDQIATKEDIHELRAEVSQVRQELKEDISRVEKKADISHAKLEGKLNKLEWMFAFILAFIVALSFKVFF